MRRVCVADGVQADAATMRAEMSGQSGIRVAVAGFGRLASDVTRGLAAVDGMEIVGIARRQAMTRRSGSVKPSWRATVMSER